MVANVQAFLGATAAGGTSVGGTVVATPVAAQVKGSDGPDWTVACVLLHVRARIAAEAVTAYGHCERMTWLPQQERWVIAAGDPPARAPSTWPETDLARQAGWRTWVDAHHDTPNTTDDDNTSDDGRAGDHDRGLDADASGARD